MHPNILKVCRLPFYRALDLFQCGFELETQTFQGKNARDSEQAIRNGGRSNSEPPIDEVAFEAARQAHIASIMAMPIDEALLTFCSQSRSHRLTSGMLVGFVKNKLPRRYPELNVTTFTKETFLAICQGNGLSLNHLCVFILAKGQPSTADWIKNRIDFLVREQHSMSNNPYYVRRDAFVLSPSTPPPRPPANHTEYFKSISKAWHPALTCVPDGSVSGPEIKTTGPVSVKEFCQIVPPLFQNSMTVDNGCSFHIHLSIKGVPHNYGREMQAAIYEGLLRQYDKFPQRVKDRLGDHDKRTRYFKEHLTEDKYCMVNQHKGFKTWEFRLFGNIDNAKDAQKCMLIAVRSLIFAYNKIYLKRKPDGVDLANVFMDNEYNRQVVGMLLNSKGDTYLSPQGLDQLFNRAQKILKRLPILNGERGAC